MTIISMRPSRGLVWSVLAAFALFLMPAGLGAAAGRGAAPGAGSLTGFIYAQNARTPVSGAVVKIRGLSGGEELASQPTDANGMYTITDIPEGRYVLGVSSDKGEFNLDYAFYVKGGELGKLSIALVPGAAAAAGQTSGEEATKKKGFFSSTAGHLLIIAAVGVGLYFLIVPENNEASPIR